MSCVQAVKKYVERMIQESEPGYKIMLMDKETVSIFISKKNSGMFAVFLQIMKWLLICNLDFYYSFSFL